jgi:hypothetical protein
VRAPAAHFGIPWNRYRLISVPELAAAIGVLAGLRHPALGVLTAHRRARDSIATMAPALAAFVITAAYLAAGLTR